MSTHAKPLLEDANCYECFGDSGLTLQLMKLGLLRQLAIEGTPGFDASPQALLDLAKCYICYATNPYMLHLLKLALLAQWVSAVPMDVGRETEEGEDRVTEDGDDRIIED